MRTVRPGGSGRVSPRFRASPLHVLARYAVPLLVMIVCLAPSGRDAAAGADGTPEGWKIGYWFWQTRWSSHIMASGPVPDLLYALAGSIRFARPDEEPGAMMRWPGRLPKASACFVVLRVDDDAPPREDLVPRLVAAYRSVKGDATLAGASVVGFQLDYDCPTRLLGDYGVFLARLREALPPEDRLSITALLDWFRPGTAVDALMKSVDEFVPQFYDTGDKDAYKPFPGVAAPIDAARWAPVFNAMGKPYRIGISVFGRILRTYQPGDVNVPAEHSVDDRSPLEIFGGKALVLTQRGVNAAGETLLRFERRRESEKGGMTPPPAIWETITVEMILPTAESLASAYRAALAFGGSCAGVVFYRWPTAGEAMVLRPDEVERILAGGERAAVTNRVEVEDGYCAAVHCSNLLIRLADRFPFEPVTVLLQSSVDLDYFIPAERVKATLRGRRSIEVRIPAFAGVPAILAGRAVSTAPADFTIEVRP